MTTISRWPPLPPRSPGFCLTFLPWGTPTHPPPIPSSFSHIVHHPKTPSLPFDMSLRFCNNSATQEHKDSVTRPYLIDGFSRGLCMAFKHIMYVCWYMRYVPRPADLGPRDKNPSPFIPGKNIYEVPARGKRPSLVQRLCRKWRHQLSRWPEYLINGLWIDIYIGCE